jgi:type II secretory pathway component PulM
MMSALYFIVEVFPWWAIPLALILVELAAHFRRTARAGKAVLCLLTAITLVALTGFFIWENGPRNARNAMQRYEKNLFSLRF